MADDDSSQAHSSAPTHGEHGHAHARGHERTRPILAAVLTVSDRSARGERTDTSGPRAVEILKSAGFEVGQAAIVPDGVESVRDGIESALASGARVVITTGGTGVGPRDLTPEGTRGLLLMELPGISEALRRDGQKYSQMSIISRGLAGIAELPAVSTPNRGVSHVSNEPRRALIVNLPGSVGAVEQGLDVLVPIIAHIIGQLDGGDH